MQHGEHRVHADEGHEPRAHVHRSALGERAPHPLGVAAQPELPCEAERDPAVRAAVDDVRHVPAQVARLVRGRGTGRVRLRFRVRVSVRARDRVRGRVRVRVRVRLAHRARLVPGGIGYG